MLQPLAAARFAHLQGTISQCIEGGLRSAAAGQLVSEVVSLASDGHHMTRPLDPRVVTTFNLIKEWTFSQATLSALARRLNLSPSRLSHLFVTETGVTIAHYRRYRAVFRALQLALSGRSFTETWT